MFSSGARIIDTSLFSYHHHHNNYHTQTHTHTQNSGSDEFSLNFSPVRKENLREKSVMYNANG
jgi:hypothetical protein